MFTPLFVFYYGLLLIGTTAAVYWWKKRDRRSQSLFFLFAVTLVFELFMDHCYTNGIKSYRYLYPLFSGFEYGMLVIFYVGVIKNTIWRWFSIGSAVLFGLYNCAGSALIYSSYEHHSDLITYGIAMEGTMLIVLFSQLLFRIDDDIPVPLYRHPDFWVAVGILIFNSGVFVVFVCYPLLVKMNRATVGQSYGFILQPANITEYVCINLRFLCLYVNRNLIRSG